MAPGARDMPSMGVGFKMWWLRKERLLLMMMVVMVTLNWWPVSASASPFARPDSDDNGGEDQDPQFVNTPTHVTVKEGALAILPCWVRYLGNREVAWRRLSDDTFLTIGRVTWVQDSNLVLEHLRKGKGVTSWDLIFRQARLDQAGDYECQVTSQDKHVRTVTLTVIDEPTFNSQLIVPTGQLIRLECNMSTLNQSKFDLHWYKNGRKVKADTYPYYIVTRYEVQSTQMYVTDLIIENASLDDSGIYTCRSSRQIIDTTKVTVIRSDPSNSKREETREDLIPKPVEDVRDSMFGENILPDDTHSFFSTDRLPSKSSDGKSGSAGLLYRHRGLCWLTPCLPAALLWGFLLLLRHLHLPLCVIRLPAS